MVTRREIWVDSGMSRRAAALSPRKAALAPPLEMLRAALHGLLVVLAGAGQGAVGALVLAQVERVEELGIGVADHVEGGGDRAFTWVSNLQML
jgi:hypothetical protein